MKSRGIVFCVMAVELILAGILRVYCVRDMGVPPVKDDAALYFIAGDQLHFLWLGHPLPQPDIMATVLRDRKPVYPIILSILFLVFPDLPHTVILFQIILDLCSLMILVVIGESVCRWSGVIAGLIYSVCLPAVTMVRYVMTESTAVFLILLATLAILRKKWVSAGFLSGCLLMLRPACSLFPVFFLAGIWVYHRTARRKTLMLFMTGFLAVWLPVKIWLLGMPRSGELWSSRSGVALAAGYDLDTDGWWVTDPVQNARPTLSDSIEKVQAAIPLDFVRLAVVRVYRMYLRPMSGHDYPWAPDNPPGWLIAYCWFYWLLLFLASTRVLVAAGDVREWPAAAGIFSLTVLHSLTYAHQRYAVPALPLIIMLAVFQMFDFSHSKIKKWQMVAGAILFFAVGVSGYINDHRPVEWMLLEKGQIVTRVIDLPEIPGSIHGQIRADVRLSGPGVASLAFYANGVYLGMSEFQAYQPMDSPGWVSYPSQLGQGRHVIGVEYRYGSSDVSIAVGSLKHLPETRKSYNRWWVLGDARILSRHRWKELDGPVIVLEFPAGSGVYF